MGGKFLFGNVDLKFERIIMVDKWGPAQLPQFSKIFKLQWFADI